MGRWILNPILSVLMPAFREERKIFIEAIESVLEQTFVDFELILIIDDPGNIELIKLTEEYAQKDSRIRLLINRDNVGLVNSLNRAISLARGKYFCRMDADDISYPERFKRQIQEIEKHNLDFVGAKVDVVDSYGAFLYSSEGLPHSPQVISRALRWNNCVPHSTWMGKREVFKHGYRNIDLCEDYDFLLRASLANYRIGNCSEPLLAYRMTDRSISRSNLYKQYLGQVYLSYWYSKKEIVRESSLESWICNNYSSKKNEQYAKANILFNEGMKNISRKKAYGVWCLLKIPFVSIQYCGKLKRLFMAGILGFRDK